MVISTGAFMDLPGRTPFWRELRAGPHRRCGYDVTSHCSRTSVEYIRAERAQLRAYIGRNTALEDNGFYANIYPVDNVVVRAIGILKEENEND